MRRSLFAVTASALALSIGPGHAMAQQAMPLSLDQEVAGALTDQDARVDDGDMGQYIYDLYEIRARQGQRLEFILRSDAFDSYLELLNLGSDEVLAADDDGLGEGFHSRLRHTVGQDGVLILRARNLSGLEGGDYVLKVIDRGPAAPAPAPTTVRIGQSINGEITEGDPEDEGTDAWSTYLYDAYRLQASQGDRIALTLESEPFDPIVRIGRMNGEVFEELASNDDSPAGGLNSYLVFTVPADGEYIVRAAPLGGTQTGPYSLSLAEGPPPMAMRPIAFGDTVEETLSENDGANMGGRRADAYTFQGRAGQRIVAVMSSDDFDAYLDLYAGQGDDRYLLDSDDDGAGEGTDSRLAYTLTDDGEYTLEARAFSEGGEGAYTLSLTESAPDPEPAPLAYGQTIQGEISDTDPRDDDNRGFDAFRITGTEGTRIQVIMRSGDFDTFLQIGSPEGDFYALASDDDGLGEGTDSRLNYILPSTGDFILRASALYGEADGLYSLELIDRGPRPAPGSILIGATARGTLTEADAISEDGAFYDAYEITVKEGDKLRLTMVSNEFDAYLDIGREDEGVFTSIASDDDGLSDTHAKVDWAVEEAGEYVIRARSFSSGQSGAYALTVEPRE